MGDDGATSDVAFAAFHSSATRLVSDDGAEDTVSHLAAVGASLATMEDSVIERSLDFILFPVVGVMRRASEPETNDADANPKARARRIKTLEESLRCVSAVLRRLEPGMGEPAFIGDLFCDVVAVLARSGSDPSLDDPSSGTRSSSSSADLEDLRLAAVTCASDVVRLIRPRTTHARALLADKNLPAVGYATSLLVRVAHLEASAGTKGSKAIRCAALATLRDLVSEHGRSRRVVLLPPRRRQRARQGAARGLRVPVRRGRRARGRRRRLGLDGGGDRGAHRDRDVRARRYV